MLQSHLFAFLVLHCFGRTKAHGATHVLCTSNVHINYLQAPFKQQGRRHVSNLLSAVVVSFCSDPAYVSGTCALGPIASSTLHFLLMLHTLPSFLLPHYFLNFKQLGVHGHLAESRDQSAQLHQRRNSLQDLHMCHANLLWG